MLTMTDPRENVENMEQEYLSFMYPEIGTNGLELRPLAVIGIYHPSNTDATWS